LTMKKKTKKTTAGSPATPDQKTNRTLVNIVLDRSGSMGSRRKETIDGLNEYFEALRKDGKGIQYFINLIQFDSPADGPELTVTHLDKPLSEVSNLTAEQYEPRGMTPYYDALGECIRRVETKDRSVLCVVITDGEENASREFDLNAIKAMVKEKEDKDHWTFVYLGADLGQQVYTQAAATGGLAGNTVSYTNSANTYRVLGNVTMKRAHVAQARGMSTAASMQCFTAADKVSMGDVTVDPNAGIDPNAAIPAGGTPSPVSSGSFTVSGTFGGASPSGPTFRVTTGPVSSKPAGKRRNWRTSNTSA